MEAEEAVVVETEEGVMEVEDAVVVVVVVDVASEASVRRDRRSR